MARVGGVLLLAFALSACAPAELPSLPNVRLVGVPNLSQDQPLFDPQLYTQTLCAPVAVANSLVWLQGRTDTAYQVAVVNTLAGYRYMLTRPILGTSPQGLLRGVRRYLREQGIEYAALRYAGWREVGQGERDAGMADLRWLHAGLTERGALWLNLGWYRESLPGVYERLGGHWVTAVGYVDGELVVHDPQREVPVNLPVTQRGSTAINAAGWRLLEGVLSVPGRPDRPEEVGFIDGAVRLELPPGQRPGGHESLLTPLL